MGIDIIVQNQIHQPIETVTGPAGSTLPDIVLRDPRMPMFQGIHNYADTMFNSYQLQFLLRELNDFEPRSEGERETISSLQRAAELAIREHGYLWFSGD
ncbi:hypothetical protein [Nocardia grenadensis]|uniref:hypothetical protein n=1 Tax=Nocardia grenadensis TaxID=931537 RepID=UPI000A88296E|nr:hypothetical protein [Nocardia grenadensis]